MKSRARRFIEKQWHGANNSGVKNPKKPFWVGEGNVFIFPSRSGEFSHHVVTRTIRKTPKNSYVEWSCSCPAWYHSEEDKCPHVAQASQQWEIAALLS
jgi:hypothetical protein